MIEKIKHSLKSNIKQNLTLNMLRHALRIIAGMGISVLLAQAFNVKFAPSAAIITLLCIQATKRDTLKAAVKYTVSFLYTIAFAVLVHLWLGIGLLSFFVTLLPLVLLSFAIGFENTISVSTVVIIHLFIQQQPFTGELILNELIRVIIGVGIAILINWRFPDDETSFKSDIILLEQKISLLLNYLANSLNGSTDFFDDVCEREYKEIERLLSSGFKKAYRYAGNNFSDKAEFYIQYMNLRESECVIIQNLVLSSKKMNALCQSDDVTIKNDTLADCVKAVADNLAIESTSDNIILLEQNAAELKSEFEAADMPRNHDELLCKFIQFSMINDLSEMLNEKKHFCERIKTI